MTNPSRAPVRCHDCCDSIIPANVIGSAALSNERPYSLSCGVERYTLEADGKWRCGTCQMRYELKNAWVLIESLQSERVSDRAERDKLRGAVLRLTHLIDSQPCCQTIAFCQAYHERRAIVVSEYRALANSAAPEVAKPCGECAKLREVAQRVLIRFPPQSGSLLDYCSACGDPVTSHAESCVLVMAERALGSGAADEPSAGADTAKRDALREGVLAFLSVVDDLKLKCGHSQPSVVILDYERIQDLRALVNVESRSDGAGGAG